MNSISEKLKTLCFDKNISKDELSTLSGLTPIQIAMIENNEKIPSLASLIKISRALGVRLGTFLDDSEHIGPVIHTNNDKKSPVTFSSQLSNTNSHMDFVSLAANKATRHMEPFLIDVHKNDEAKKVSSSHEGEEFIYVLNGTINIRYGKKEYTLHQGESIYYDSIIDHLVYTEIKESAQILAVVYTPL